MELLLRKNIEKLGRIGDVVNVSKGYARNYLLPKGLAVEISAANMKQLEKERLKLEQKLREERVHLQEILEKISSTPCIIPAKANEEGRLFGSVTAVHIAEALQKQDCPITEDKVKLNSPIKECGEYVVTISLSQEMKADCRVTVVREEKS